MPTLNSGGGSSIFFNITGNSNIPVILLHGSLSDHKSWDSVVLLLSRDLRVIVYDRRGHSQSISSRQEDSIFDDAEDLAAIIEQASGCPAHIVGTSGGAAIALRLACNRPDLFHSLTVHEPPLIEALPETDESQQYKRELSEKFDVFVKTMESGRSAEAVGFFVDAISDGSGTWDNLPTVQREIFTKNAWTLFHEFHDKDFFVPDYAGLSKFKKPVLFTQGGKSAPFFSKIIDILIATSLPDAERLVYQDAGHMPHETHPHEYANTVVSFIKTCSTAP